MKNLWTTINVKDMDESIKFYTEILDLTLDKRYKASEDMEIAFLCSGETKFEMICNSHVRDISFSGNVSTGFSVENADDYIKHLEEKGVPVIAGPFEPSEHIKFFFVNDPNGYKIQLVELR